MVSKLHIGLLNGLVALALVTGAPTAWGQDMDFGSDPGEVDDGGEGGMDFSEPAPEDEGYEEAPPEDDLLGDIGVSEEPETEEVPESTGPRQELPPPEIWAVQRIYALRYHRVELVPRFSFSMNDQFVSHYGFGGELNWYITDVLALGLEGIWFFGNRETDTNYYTSRSFRVSIPINEYWMGWYLNFSYVPIYGKFGIFNRWIVHWDTFIVGGLGVTLTRPIAVIDSEFRDFSTIRDWNPNITFNIGLGGRIFFTRWLALFAELRVYGFPQKLENREVMPLDDQCDSESSCPPDTWDYQRANPDTWLDDDGEFAVNVMVEVGLSIFLPLTFEYRLPL